MFPELLLKDAYNSGKVIHVPPYTPSPQSVLISACESHYVPPHVTVAVTPPPPSQVLGWSRTVGISKLWVRVYI